MYVRKYVSVQIIWHFSWLATTIFFVLACAAYFAFVYLKWTMIAIPFLPVATIGTAVAFYVGFKNNASYDRQWEARKIWSEIEHLSRFWAMILTQAKVNGLDAGVHNSMIAHRLVYRQIAWVNALKYALRNEFAIEDVDNSQHLQVTLVRKFDANQIIEFRELLAKFISPIEVDEVIDTHNICARLLTKQMDDLNSFRDEGLSTEEYIKLLDVLQALSQQQSATERINRFPFPRQYAHFSAIFVYIFILLLPFSLLNELNKNDPGMLWLMIPVSVLLSWIFYTMEKVGDSSENPFENGLNDVPMTSICRDVEIDLRSMLRETSLPDRLRPREGILM
ncbi:MAG: bestrophin family ion channel [Candidatus Obscuribacterales bacterium]|nr:bestrophin family ion channel [Candidatus Obscuribacterales bacterium]